MHFVDGMLTDPEKGPTGKQLHNDREKFTLNRRELLKTSAAGAALGLRLGILSHRPRLRRHRHHVPMLVEEGCGCRPRARLESGLRLYPQVT